LVGTDDAWVLAEDEPERALGKALVWAERLPVDEVHLLVETGAGALARRAGAFAHPARVWSVHGVQVEPAAPDPVPAEGPISRETAAFADLITEAGAEPVVEHGVLKGEVLGLEVARVVPGDQGPYLEVGVGKHDRYAQRLVHGDAPPHQALERAVATVRHHRRADAPHHPLNRLAPERWLRARLVAEPGLVDADQLRPVPSPAEREDLRLPSPAAAAGIDAEGRPLLAVCSTGVDVDLVPAAADYWLADPRRPRLLIVVPERDDHPLLRRLAGALRRPAEIRTVLDDWRQMSPLR